MVIALGALVVACWFLLLAPKRDDLSALKDKIGVAQTRLQTAQTAAQAASTAKASYERDYKTVANLGKAVPVDDDVPALVYDVQHASSATRVAFGSIKLSGAVTPSAAPAVAT